MEHLLLVFYTFYMQVNPFLPGVNRRFTGFYRASVAVLPGLCYTDGRKEGIFMKETTMAQVIADRRKELGMTQKELAEKMNITDKAVSKWERGIACPDTASIPKLAQVLGVSLETLMACGEAQSPGHRGAAYLTELILKAVPLAMGIAVTVTAVLGTLEVKDGLTMLGIGLACLALRQMKEG